MVLEESAPSREARTPGAPMPPVADARTTSSNLESSRPPCRFFLLGKCKFGDACTFSHRPQGRVPVCTFFQQNGSCRYGETCKFLHGSETAGATMALGSAGSAPASGAAISDPRASGVRVSISPGAPGGSTATAGAAAAAVDAGGNCGICLENIPASGKRFGLLNCDHVYCLECLRTWRKSRGAQKDISRTCPECRKVSFFLVPSKEHLKGKAKQKAIQAYKKGLSKLPCKYHKADGSTVCPFGPRCFYAHLDENGVDMKNRSPPAPQPRRACPYLRGRGSDGALANWEIDARRAGFRSFHQIPDLAIGDDDDGGTEDSSDDTLKRKGGSSHWS